MKSHSSNRSWVKAVTFGTLGLAAALVTFRAEADQWDKKTTFTVDQPIQIRNTYLQPGTYVLKLADSVDRHIVYIYNANQNHLIDTVMAIPNYRLRPTGNSEFVFWETPPGTARAMRAWFWPGDNYGQEFAYPTNLRQIAAVTTAKAPAPIAAAPEAAGAPPPAPPTQPEVAQAAPPPAQVEEKETVEIAQNTPPPAPPPAPAPEAAPAPPPPPQELPKTATPYPLVGLGGLLSFGLYALVRMKRTA